jgi:hypothetical protein
MSNFMYLFRGGQTPTSPEAMQAQMQRWRAGRTVEAREFFQKALRHTDSLFEQRLLERKLHQCEVRGGP